MNFSSPGPNPVNIEMNVSIPTDYVLKFIGVTITGPTWILLQNDIKLYLLEFSPDKNCLHITGQVEGKTSKTIQFEEEKALPIIIIDEKS